MYQIKFGTDGWRGVISDDFTFENVIRVAQAIADYYKKTYAGKGLSFVVGFDTRFLSEKYAELVAKVLSANGISVLLSKGPIPTPVVSFTAKERGYSAGVMITASHNPAQYNGIKIKTAKGQAAGVDITTGVENLIREYDPALLSRAQENLIKKEDLTDAYVKFLRSYIDLKKLKNAKFKVLIDIMHGSGDKFFERVLKGTGIRLTFTRSDINPSFEGLRPEPVVENLQETIARMKKEKFDLCLILDGDADRIAAIGPGGVFIHPQKILGLLLLHLHEDRGFSGGVIKTIAGTAMIDHIANKLGVKIYETPVGFKYISDLMVNENIVVGGEEAGGMGFKDYVPERDGTLAGILLLEMMCYRKTNMLTILEKVEKEFGKYYYVRRDLKLTRPMKLDVAGMKAAIKDILGKPVVQIKDYDGVKFICDDESWLMFRGSGTEPLMRLYAESKSLTRANQYLDFGNTLIEKYGI